MSRNGTRSGRWAVLAVAVVVGASSLVACGGGDEVGLMGVVRTPPIEVGDLAMPDAVTGQPFAYRPPSGELYLVYFGYTSCPDICPTTMTDISVALGDLKPKEAERVSVVMTTVDPERDTGDVMPGYLATWFTRAHALRTTDDAQLTAAKELFGVQSQVPAHVPGENYEVAHTAITYVVDDTGTVQVEWPFGFKSEAMTSDIKYLLNEEKHG